VKCAFARRLPWQRRFELGRVGWILVGTARVVFDLRQFGLLRCAITRMIYYAAFFFVAQALSTEETPAAFPASMPDGGRNSAAAGVHRLPEFSPVLLPRPDGARRSARILQDDLLERSWPACAVHALSLCARPTSLLGMAFRRAGVSECDRQ